VAPTRGGPYTYQWYAGTTLLTNGPTGSGSIIAGATTASLVVSNVSVADCTNYYAVVTNPGGSAISALAQLDLAIQITTQPVSIVVPPGGTANFSVAATGHGTLHYQWLFNGSPMTDGGGIVGSGTPNLTINNVQTANIGAYVAAINDDYIASTNSQTAFLDVATA